MTRNIAFMILVGAIVVAQAVPPARKPTKPRAVSKPVSGYMRRVGLLYLETIADFEKACGYEGRKNHTCDSDRWDSTFSSLEDRVEISLSESHSAGDKLFWALLKNARTSTQLFLSTEAACFIGQQASPALQEAMGLQQELRGGSTEWSPEVACKQEEAFLAVYPICQSYAHSDAVDGTYWSDGGCSAKLTSALQANNQPQAPKPKPDPNLIAKCTPFSHGSAARIERGAEAVPPKECAEVLGWLRNVDYDRLVTRHDQCSLPSFANDPEWCEKK